MLHLPSVLALLMSFAPVGIDTILLGFTIWLDPTLYGLTMLSMFTSCLSIEQSVHHYYVKYCYVRWTQMYEQLTSIMESNKLTCGYQNYNTCQVLIFGRYVKVKDECHEFLFFR